MKVEINMPDGFLRFLENVHQVWKQDLPEPIIRAIAQSIFNKGLELEMQAVENEGINAIAPYHGKIDVQDLYNIFGVVKK